MKKKNILQVIGGMNMGGAETFLMNVLRNIDNKKYNFIFLCYGNDNFDYEKEILNLGAKIIRIKKPSSYFDIQLIKEIKNVIEKNNIEIVHCHTYYNSMYAILAAKMKGIKKIIIHSHNTNPDPTNNIIKKMYFKISKIIINLFSTKYIACGIDAGKSLFYNKNQFQVIDNGIIVDNFYYNEKYRKEIRKELNINDDTILIGHIGRFDEQKNHVLLIKIFKEYNLSNKKSKLVLIGAGELKNKIMNLVDEYKLKDSVIFLGKRSDVNKIYSAIDLFLFPSLYEGLPVTLIEAQTNGVPIVASSTIDHDVDFTNSINFVDLNASIEIWTNKIQKNIKKRKNNNKIVSKSKYNMINNVYKIENIYSE